MVYTKKQNLLPRGARGLHKKDRICSQGEQVVYTKKQNLLPRGARGLHKKDRICSQGEQVQWNLGNSNANFSKLPDFSKTTDGPDFFHYNLLQKYHRFFEFQFFEKINFSNRFVGPDQRNSY